MVLSRFMQIILNGKETKVKDHSTLQELLEEMEIKPQMIASELNSKIIRRSEYATTQIHPGDRLEILQMIGGG